MMMMIMGDVASGSKGMASALEEWMPQEERGSHACTYSRSSPRLVIFFIYLYLGTSVCSYIYTHAQDSRGRKKKKDELGAKSRSKK